LGGISQEEVRADCGGAGAAGSAGGGGVVVGGGVGCSGATTGGGIVGSVGCGSSGGSDGVAPGSVPLGGCSSAMSAVPVSAAGVVGVSAGAGAGAGSGWRCWGAGSA